ncbi:hypothetical protein [Salipiger sp. PrR002]|uniref:hypothetical protein n=1 Tax=Salipiger sp. PrR002 TaxID=2706489 RepID=UPI0013BD7928|nr:hypothetical protein [Salipiger sp. PrR002]NDW01147.1 hypothetical protein [Salipiger sp. PrR002]NDW58811.1 hypothetical protein [Salipiger sp. PrR004]
MFDEQRSCEIESPAVVGDTSPLRAFAEEHREALIRAAELLAGRRGERLALEVADALAGAAPLARRDMRQLHALLDILALENVDDRDSEECARFALIDPASPIVEEICLLNDGLRDAIDRTDLDHPWAARFSAAA